MIELVEIEPDLAEAPGDRILSSLRITSLDGSLRTLAIEAIRSNALRAVC